MILMLALWVVLGFATATPNAYPAALLNGSRKRVVLFDVIGTAASEMGCPLGWSAKIAVPLIEFEVTSCAHPADRSTAVPEVCIVCCPPTGIVPLKVVWLPLFPIGTFQGLPVASKKLSV